MSDRFRDTAAIWNWLPAFRAVAETEHLPTAGEMMSVTPPALSRSVRNLEDALGRDLFTRTGRHLELNEDGRRLAAAVRTAMRTVHSALDELTDPTFHGPMRWASMWSMSRVVVKVLAEVVADHPRLVPQMFPIEPIQCVTQLQRGELDLAVLTSRVDVEGLTTVELGPLPHSVYCGPTHPLAGRAVDIEDLANVPFAAPIADELGRFGDGWPAEAPRNVTMQFALMEVGYAACQAGLALAVLPDGVADGLWRLHGIDDAPTAYAVHRDTIVSGPVEEIVARLATLH